MLQKLNRPTKAEGYLLRAVELEPESLDYLYALTIHYISRGMRTEAESFLEQMTAINPEFARRSEAITAFENMYRIRVEDEHR